MPLMTREQILGATKLPIETVDVPEWGGQIAVRTMSGTERDAWEASRLKRRGRRREVDLQDARASLCARCICDAEGKPLFTIDDVTALGQTSAKALDRVFSVAQRLNGVSDDDMVELEKN